MRILSFDQSRPRGHPSAGRKQMLDQELRQPRFIALGLPALFHDQHPIEIIKRSIYYSIGGMLVNRRSPGELLTSPLDRRRMLMVGDEHLRRIEMHAVSWRR